MTNQKDNCCSCGILTDHKNNFGHMCEKCNEAVDRIFKKLVKEKSQ
jgi:hypothetical protein